MNATHLLRTLALALLLLNACGVEGVVTQPQVIASPVISYALQDWGIAVSDEDNRIPAEILSKATDAALRRFSQLDGHSQKEIEEGLAKVNYTVRLLSTEAMAPYILGVTLTGSEQITTMVDNTRSKKGIIIILTHEYLHALEAVLYHPVYTEYTQAAYHSRPGWFETAVTSGHYEDYTATLEWQMVNAAFNTSGL